LNSSGRSTLTIVFLTVFVDLLGFGIVIPLLPLYAERYHPTPLQFGLLMSSYSAMQFLFAPLLGRLSDRVGRRPVLLVSLLGNAAGYVVFAFAHSLAALFCARIVAGITGANIGTAQAVIADVTSDAERARGMGMVGMAFGLGFVFGPALGGFAVGLGEAAPGLFACALSLTAFTWALLRLPETRPAGDPGGRRARISLDALLATMRRPVLGAILLLALLTTTAFANFESTFSQFLHARFATTPATVSWLFVTLGITSALVQGLLVRALVRRLGEPRLLPIGMAVLGAGFVALAAARTVPLLLVAIVLMALGWGLTNPCLGSYLSKRSAASEQGAALGSMQAMASLGRIAGPVWGETVFFRFGPPGPYATGAALQALAVVLAALLLPRENAPR